MIALLLPVLVFVLDITSIAAIAQTVALLAFNWQYLFPGNDQVARQVAVFLGYLVLHAWFVCRTWNAAMDRYL